MYKCMVLTTSEYDIFVHSSRVFVYRVPVDGDIWSNIFRFERIHVFGDMRLSTL